MTSANLQKYLPALFWLTSVVLLAISFKFYNIPESENTFFINIYDTFVVLQKFQFLLFLSLFYFLLGFGYWLVKKVKGRLKPLLSFAHAFIMFGSLIIYGFFALSNSESLNFIFSISAICIIFIAEPIYVINLMIGIFNWRRDRKIEL